MLFSPIPTSFTKLHDLFPTTHAIINMRPASLLIFVVAAVSSPVYGAPLLSTTQYARDAEAFSALLARDVPDDQSGAFGLGSLFNIGRKVFGLGNQFTGGYVDHKYMEHA